MFQYLAKETGQRKGPICRGIGCVPFLKKMGDIFASFQTSESFPVSMDFLKIRCRIEKTSSCNVCRIMGFNLLGLVAICWFKPLSSMSMPLLKCLYQAFWDGDCEKALSQ